MAPRRLSLATAARRPAARPDATRTDEQRRVRLLPTGGTLPPAAFEARHRTVVWLLWAHVVALPLFAVSRGYSIEHGLLDVGPIAFAAVAAGLRRFGPRIRASLGALGLVTCSAILTHLWGGVTEAHFHFFVAVALLSLYEDWMPWGLSFAFVLAHHGIMGAVDPRSVYGAHADAVQHPWHWAAIHAGFILALSLVNVVTWRSNERARELALDSRAKLDWRTRHDPLTGLPNRREFVDRVQDTLERRRTRLAGSGHVAVLFVDLDDFKTINDSLGHGAGDRLIQAVAQRLREVLRPEDVIARFGSDEFTVLLPGLGGEHEARQIAARIGGALEEPVFLDGEARFVTASVGMALTPDEGAHDAAGLLQDADAAMYHAKELGKARCAVFDESMRERARERLELDGALREALARGELQLLYQPQVRLADGAVIGVEALLRWRHPRLGTVSPAAFIPIAERTGLIVPIGEWVLAEACAQAMRWDHDELEVAVNVSAIQLSAPGFAATVRRVLAETGLAPGRLCLEVTETVLLADVPRAQALLAELKGLGVRLAVDDFGVGHASLRHLRQLLPVDKLKIDKSFVDGLVDDAHDAAIVDAVVRLAAGLGLECVAEGVEHAEQAAALTAIDCHSVQGFHFARPLPADEVAALLVGAPA
ncbi:MAG TPA: bifunctional diguanylate cyclase/phosphodiesterase [Baekduia sp.]|nr:bifunctional diguanylate cyclase/phosphodiesterase [Baekduia sp.]